jgi:hypothetical protein
MASTGAIASKDRAAAWLLARGEAATHRAVIEQAHAANLGQARDELAHHPEAVAARQAIEGLCAAAR